MIRPASKSPLDAAAPTGDARRTDPTLRPATPGRTRLGRRGATPRQAEPAGTGLRWWREALVVVVFYSAYTAVRDLHGRRPVSVAAAQANALRIIRAERWLHVFVEQRVQAAFLHDRLLVSLLDDYYGTAHFVVVVVVLVLLYRRAPTVYRRWRATLAITTTLALIGFLFFPVMPPRLLPASYHFVDTLRVVGGLWDFGSAPVNDVSNQFAAMPSLHTAWSTWCACAVQPLLHSRRWRIAVFAYPALTVFCIVVTGNHYLADAAGGVVTLAVAYGLATGGATVARRWQVRHAIRAAGAR